MNTAFSNLISNFGGSLPNVDLMSLVSDPIQVNVTNAYQDTGIYVFTARYMCVGSLLIQFSDASNGTSEFYSGDGSITFPIPYQTTPYMVRIGTLNADGGIVLNLNSWSTTALYFNITTANDDQKPDVTFLSIGPNPQILNMYYVNSITNGSITPCTNVYNGIKYHGIIIQATNTPGNDSCVASLYFTTNINNAYMLVVGGGGGGGGSNDSYGSGGGGGGGTFYCNVSSILNILGNSNNPITINVGTGGAGGLNGATDTLGGSGNTSSVQYNDASYGQTTITAYGGSGGDSGVNTGSMGGVGGSTSCSPSTIDTIGAVGGSGGGGGGGWANTADGGDNGNYNTNVGGNGSEQQGGNSYYSSNVPQLPFYNYGYVNVGGGGGCGAGTETGVITAFLGGCAGAGVGGQSYSNNDDGNGSNATYELPSSSTTSGYYGGGGGGGACYFIGGNGGNGVVMIWWEATS